MDCQYDVTCPNCGRPAKRIFLRDSRVIRTQCGCCDYLMVTCEETGRVIEAYSPGTYAKTLR